MPEPDAPVRRCQQGELAAFTDLFRAYQAPLYRLALAILREPADAEDALQETYLRVFRQIRDYRGQAALRTWLTAILVNVCRDHLRRARLRRMLPLDWLRGPSQPTAPDPAELMATDGGLSSLLTEAEDVEEGEQTRDGETVLTTYTATVPGEAVGSLLPSADAAADFDAVFSVDGEDRLTRVELTGPFYPDADAVTYVVGLADYGTEKKIVAP